MCPTDPNTGSTCYTGCVATALAQVINYHKYPTSTVAAIPEYTSNSRSITMPEIGITTIDWANMLDDYSGRTTADQQNAVAQLMLLCGQAVEMDYTSEGSGAYTALDVRALQTYFGFSKTTRIIERNSCTTDTWMSLLYDELANNRPVLYSGASTGGGHAFVVDGIDSDGLFHINWGWGGYCDGYFQISVLNPYSNSGIGASSSEDGYSFGQEAVFGIQHDTDDESPSMLSVVGIENTGATTFTRSSSSDNFTGINIKPTAYNMTGVTHQFAMGLGLVDSEGSFQSFLKFQGGQYSAVSFGDLEHNYGGYYEFQDIYLGENLTDGVYWILPLCSYDDNGYWYYCWFADNYKIKAVISGNTLTLSNPTVSLKGSLSVADVPVVNETMNLMASIDNSGSYFNDYVYLLVDNDIKGGRIFEVGEGESADFNIDYVPTTTGDVNIALAYLKDREYVPFLSETVKILSERPAADGLAGDVNSDSYINVTDVALMIDYVLGKNPVYFNSTAADVNADGYINVTDIATVIDAILGKTTLNGAKGSTVVFSNTHTVTPQPVAGEVPPTMVRNIFKR